MVYCVSARADGERERRQGRRRGAEKGSNFFREWARWRRKQKTNAQCIIRDARAQRARAFGPYSPRQEVSTQGLHPSRARGSPREAAWRFFCELTKGDFLSVHFFDC